MLRSLLRKIKPDRRVSLLRLLPDNAVCAEIGVWQGAFSKLIVKETNPKSLHLIDPWKFQQGYPDRWYGGTKARNQADMDSIYEGVVAHFAGNDSVVFHREFSHEAADQFDNDYFDWVYVDGDHSYEYVMTELELYRPKVKMQGFIAGDDYNWAPSQNYPVKRAVDEFVEAGHAEVVQIQNHSFLLRRTD